MSMRDGPPRLEIQEYAGTRVGSAGGACARAARGSARLGMRSLRGSRRPGLGVWTLSTAIGAALLTTTLWAQPSPAEFVRGDVDQSGLINIADAIAVLSYLIGSTPLDCHDAADTNDDGAVSIADSIFLLGFLFAGTSAPPPPTACGPDPTSDGVVCALFGLCP